MFDSLDEQMKHDDDLETTRKGQAIKWVTISLV